jgi:hypothetical protein
MRLREIQTKPYPGLLLRQINTNNLWVPHPRHVFVFVARVGVARRQYLFAGSINNWTVLSSIHPSRSLLF